MKTLLITASFVVLFVRFRRSIPNQKRVITMLLRLKRYALSPVVCLSIGIAVASQTPKPKPQPSKSARNVTARASETRSTAASPRPNLAKEPTLYVVGYAHLDTEWRWEYPQVINEYLRKTMEENLALFEKYPHYVFNFSGANRYRLMEEYYPAEFAKLTGHVRALRCFP